jgi:hypothetical protein
MTMTTLPISQETYIESIENMRKPDVTSANSATVWARHTFANLTVRNDDGTFPFTVDMAIASVCAVYKPLTSKGKVGATIGALKDGGFPAIAARLNAVKRINGQMGVAGVADIVAAFVASQSPKDSFAKLEADVKAAVKAAAPKPEAGEGEGEGEGGTVADAARLVTLGERMAAMVAEIEALNVDEIAALDVETSAMVEAISAAWGRLADATAKLAA